MGKLFVLMGATGAGKSVQGDLLAQKLGGVHFSSGALLRRDPHAAAMLVQGKLVADDEIERVVGEAIAVVPDDQTIILDGTPRTIEQVQWLDGELKKDNRELAKVILIELDLETSLHRLHHRDRADDAPEAVRAKWDIFQTTTRVVVDHYDSAGLLVRIDGRLSIEAVHEQIMAALA